MEAQHRADEPSRGPGTHDNPVFGTGRCRDPAKRSYVQWKTFMDFKQSDNEP